jgi:hypothetical protein
LSLDVYGVPGSIFYFAVSVKIQVVKTEKPAANHLSFAAGFLFDQELGWPVLFYAYF